MRRMQLIASGRAHSMRWATRVFLCTWIVGGYWLYSEVQTVNRIQSALAAYLEDHGKLCLLLREWPIVVTESDWALQKTYPGGRGLADKMTALEAVGLVRGEDVEIGFRADGGFLPPQLAIRYTLSEAAIPFFDTQLGDVCWGNLELDSIVRIDGLKGGASDGKVVFREKIRYSADWAKRPEIRNAFASVEMAIASAENEHFSNLMIDGDHVQIVGLN